jgi:hypothetical protein
MLTTYAEQLATTLQAFRRPHRLQQPHATPCGEGARMLNTYHTSYEKTLCGPSTFANSMPRHAAIYRNPVGEVARMLNTYHGGRYRVYNLCSEKSYDPARFRLANVVAFPMDDHEVPPLPMLFDFVKCACAPSSHVSHLQMHLCTL